MSKEKITCGNCGFEEELDSAKISERSAGESGFTCSQCGMQIDVELEEAPQIDTPAPEAASADKASNISPEEVQNAEELSHAAATAQGMAHSAKEHGKKFFDAGKDDPLFISSMLDGFFKKLSSWVSPASFDSCAAFSVKAGHYAILLFTLFVLVVGILTGLRSLSLGYIFTTLGMVLILVLAQYLAVKGFQLLGGIVDRNPSKLSSPYLAELFAGLSMVLVLYSAFGFALDVLTGVNVFDLSCQLVAIVAGFFAAVAFTQYGTRLNATVDAKITSGQQCVGCVSLLSKTLISIVPFLFGFGVIFTALSTLWPQLHILFAGAQNTPVEYLVMENGIYISLLSRQIFQVAIFAASPMLVYLISLVAFLLTDVLRAVMLKK